MTWALDLLDLQRELPTADWHARLEDALERDTAAWIDAVGSPDGLSVDHAWILLSWVELTASQIPSNSRQSTLESAAFAMSLLENGPLDRRDRAVVGALLRRASELAGLDFVAGIGAGCQRAGSLGAQCLVWLRRVSSVTPSTHTETGSGQTFAFQRRQADFDVEDLERWLDNDGPD
jgi:hypothetical protein